MGLQWHLAQKFSSMVDVLVVVDLVGALGRRDGVPEDCEVWNQLNPDQYELLHLKVESRVLGEHCSSRPKLIGQLGQLGPVITVLGPNKLLERNSALPCVPSLY